MAKETKKSRNITVSKAVHDTVERVGHIQRDNRNFSSMCETLIIEALNARGEEIKADPVVKKAKK